MIRFLVFDPVWASGILPVVAAAAAAAAAVVVVVVVADSGCDCEA